VLIKHLLTHTSGLSYGAALGDPPSSATEESYQPLIQKADRREFEDLAAWCDELAALPLRFQPGEKWEYSYSIDIVGRIIEIVSGQRLDHFLFKRIMEPLGMQDTTFAVPTAKQGRLTSFYRRIDGKA
jgi:CubicO group peptidase (beta-lactamase class C family)